MQFGQGVEVKIVGDEVTVKFKLSGNFGLSASGKSNIVATTSGNVNIGDGVMLGLNAYRKA